MSVTDLDGVRERLNELVPDPLGVSGGTPVGKPVGIGDSTPNPPDDSKGSSTVAASQSTLSPTKAGISAPVAYGDASVSPKTTTPVAATGIPSTPPVPVTRPTSTDNLSTPASMAQPPRSNASSTAVPVSAQTPTVVDVPSAQSSKATPPAVNIPSGGVTPLAAAPSGVAGGVGPGVVGSTPVSVEAPSGVPTASTVFKGVSIPGDSNQPGRGSSSGGGGGMQASGSGTDSGGRLSRVESDVRHLTSVVDNLSSSFGELSGLDFPIS